MGGQALKETCRRHTAQEYNEKAEQVVVTLTALFPACNIRVVLSYYAKPDYGDLDVVITGDQLPTDWVQKVVAAFASVQTVKNGNVLSTEFQGLQVDIITHAAADFEFAASYYAFNDLGNLMGRTAFDMGLKLAHNGLYYRHKHPYKDSDVLVTDDWDTALHILGFEPAVWEGGFIDLIDIFDFVIAGRYFNPFDFDLEKRSHKAKTRDAKRDSYMKFLEYMDAMGACAIKKPTATWTWVEWKHWLMEKFPEVRARVAALEAGYERQVKIRHAFNGHMVTDLTGLRDKPLGEFMAHCRTLPMFEFNALNLEPAAFAQYIWHAYQAYEGGACDL